MGARRFSGCEAKCAPPDAQKKAGISRYPLNPINQTYLCNRPSQKGESQTSPYSRMRARPYPPSHSRIMRRTTPWSCSIFFGFSRLPCRGRKPGNTAPVPPGRTNPGRGCRCARHSTLKLPGEAACTPSAISGGAQPTWLRCSTGSMAPCRLPETPPIPGPAAET